MNNETYVPYGEEWKKEMSKLPKAAIILIAASIGQELVRLNSELVKAQIQSGGVSQGVVLLGISS